MKTTTRHASLLAALLAALTLTACSDTAQKKKQSCTPGEASCACTDNGGCNDGLECSNNVCTTPGGTQTGLTISANGARSCEVLFAEGAGVKVLGATYGDGVTGALRRQAPKVALAFSRTTDADFAGGSVQVQLSGDASALSVSQTKCYDADSKLIDGASVSLN